jgi:hypothetical protein
MPVLIGLSSAPFIASTITLSSSTNYNQNSGVVNATINTTGNRNITSVEFQLSTTSDFSSGNTSWIAASTNTTITQGSTSTSRSATPSGLSNNTTYYVRCRTINSSGFITTSSIGASFKTYKLNTVSFTGSSTWTNPVTSSGTSGLAITQLLNLEARAGGGAGGFDFATQGAGGGGAGARTTASSATISGNVTVTVGAGGGYLGELFGGPFWYPSDGNATTIGSVLSATGGISGSFGQDGGASGNGNAGGTGKIYEAGGGGGGTNGAGGNSSGTSYPYVGGAGGAGWTAGYGVGGAGGNLSSTAPTNGGTYTGNGGSGQNDSNNDSPSFGLGGSGYAYFEYWGP